jgi:ABC-type ATPase with predicted acetyltransferase domain
MISENHTMSHSAQVLLEQEMVCFHDIMAKTQEIINHSDTISLKSILELLDMRDHWIERLKQLESQKDLQRVAGTELKRSKLGRQIASIAKSLVVTDAKLLDILQIRKMNIVKEMGKIAETRGEATNAMKDIQQPTIIDTRSI